MNLVVILAAFLTIQIIDGAPVLSNDDQLVESSNRTSFELNSGCRCNVSDLELICFKVDHHSQLCVHGNTNPNVESIQILDSDLTHLEFNVTTLQNMGIEKVSILNKIKVSNTNVSEIFICEDNEDDVMKNSQLEKVPWKDGERHQLFPCEQFTNLEDLDLRFNMIKTLKQLYMPKLKELFLSGNDWHCFNGTSRQPIIELEWMKNVSSIIPDSDAIFCSRPWTNKWHQSKVKTNVTVIKLIEFNQEINRTCPIDCTCKIMNINDPLVVRVDCSNLNLTELPTILPPNTQILNVASNQIKSLAPLRDNPHYGKLKQLIAMENNITTINDIIGSPFVKNKPTTLNLQSNLLSHFDLPFMRTLLSKIETHHESVNFLFAHNPWECPCNSVQDMQDFIYAHKTWLKDSEWIACEMDEDRLLISFDYSSFCLAENTFDYVGMLVAFEVILFVLVVSKLCFDIFQYRRTGELPWLARHICLGCNYSTIKELNGSRSRRVYNTEETILSRANISDDSLSGSGKFIRLLKCFKCPFSSSSESGASMSTSNISRGAHQVSFRPRRQTEKSSFSESTATNAKISTPMATVALRKISKLGSLRTPQPTVKTISSTSKLASPVSLVNAFHFGRNHEESVQSQQNQQLINPMKKGKFTSEDCINFRNVMEPMPNENSPQILIQTSGTTEGKALYMSRNMCKSKSTSTLNNYLA